MISPGNVASALPLWLLLVLLHQPLHTYPTTTAGADATATTKNMLPLRFCAAASTTAVRRLHGAAGRLLLQQQSVAIDNNPSAVPDYAFAFE